ncbi:peptidylprolyl isomerase [Bacillus sp. REN10]|uniref:peptidylprolyl isomerase n=1 Tax=Bacillus sp. REN10 TaxID=2782541 RepID=UPI00193BE4EA|nr:peptidylprolyl isomerase [Bacillus sp. REN10]
MKKWLLSISLAAGAVGLAGCGASDDVVVTTKAGDVTKDELYDAMKQNNKQQMEQTLQELVYDKVLSEKYSVSDKELDKELKKAKEQLGSQYEMFLAQYGIDEKGFKKLIKSQLLREKAATEDMKISDKELKAYYDKWEAPVEVSHILVEDEKKAKDIKAQLDKGAKFEKLAEEHSEDPGSAANGGSVGWIDNQTRQQFAPEFAAALPKLKVGQISEPVKTDFGYHIIKITDKKEKKSFEDMKAQLTDELKSAKIDPAKLQKKLDKELKAADVKVKDTDLKGAFESKSAPAEGGPKEENKEEK